MTSLKQADLGRHSILFLYNKMKKKALKKFSISHIPGWETEVRISDYALKIIIDSNHQHPKMALAHEFGHVFTVRNISNTVYKALATQDLLSIWFIKRKEKVNAIRNEMLAWRFAKAICKPKYWKEEEAVNSIATYCKNLMINMDEKRLKIVPLVRDFMSMKRLYRGN